jgi:GTP 3',8-cyclase
MPDFPRIVRPFPSSYLKAMIDPFGRSISYLRVSVTDRCDFRCVYCMSEDMAFLPKAEILTLEELDRTCSAFIRLGVRKLRLTGGEPLVRRNIMSLVRSLGRHLKTGALDELTLTTNGSQLERYAAELKEAGIRRLRNSPRLRAGASSTKCSPASMRRSASASISRSTQSR